MGENTTLPLGHSFVANLSCCTFKLRNSMKTGDTGLSWLEQKEATVDILAYLTDTVKLR